MTKFIMWFSDHYIAVGLILGLAINLIVNLNCSTVYKADGKLCYEGTIGAITEKAEYSTDGYNGSYIIDGKEIYTISIK